MTNALVRHVEGGFSFLPGIPAFSEGIVALPRHEIVHVRLIEAVDIEVGFKLIPQRLAQADRPLAALCGIELRIPRQMEIPEFRALNKTYVETLRDRWELFVEGTNPVPRCNLALTHDPVSTPSLHGFSYTVPAKSNRAMRQFVTAGINDAVLVYGADVFQRIATGATVSRLKDAPEIGDRSAMTVERRLRFILEKATQRLAALGVSWADATQIELYLGLPLNNLLEEIVLPAISPAGRSGLRWHAGLAPFVGAEAEMDIRGFVCEIVMAPGEI